MMTTRSAAALAPPNPDDGDALCAPFIDALFVDGASIAVFASGGHQYSVGASNRVAARAEALQLELGEGPNWQVLETGRPVICPDLRAAVHEVWPTYSGAIQNLGFGAVFAFPMNLGTAVVGAVDLFCVSRRRLDVHQISLAASMASRVSTRALRLATRSLNQTPRGDARLASPESLKDDRIRAHAWGREIHQATGIVQAQLSLSATDAFARLRAHAYAASRPLDTIARDVIVGRLDFSLIDT